MAHWHIQVLLLLTGMHSMKHRLQHSLGVTLLRQIISNLISGMPPGRASGAARTVTTTRGPGQFIGEASLFEGGRGDATWKTSVRAKGKVRALLLTRSHLRSLLRQRPEAEAAVRAGAAPSCSAPQCI